MATEHFHLQSSLEQVQEIKNEMHVRNWNHQLATGQELTPGQQHPNVERLVRRQQELERWMQAHSVELAHRPSPTQVSA